MLYVIDTAPWKEEDVQKQCLNHNIEFKPGFFFELTCTKLASQIIKQHIAQEHGSSLSSLTIGEKGKPALADGSVHFNITHHGRIVVAVTSSSQPVGIDVTDRTTPFSDAELAQLFTDLPPSNLQGAYWAAREAYLKYTGEGTHEQPLHIQKPAYTVLPNLETLGSLAVMPFIRVESQYARLFSIKHYVGAVIAPRSDISEVLLFSSEIV